MQGLDTSRLRAIDQELKEAVCKAVVNLTIRHVDGSGDQGRILFGPSPRRSIVSGQLLPRFDEAGDSDETSDIRIAALGIDFQIDANANEVAHATPEFCVYVRVLPDWEELLNEELGLEMEFSLRHDVQEAVDARIRELREQRFREESVAAPTWATLTPLQKQKVRATRDRIIEEVIREAHREHGIALQIGDADVTSIENLASDGAVREISDDESTADEGHEPRLRVGRLLQRGRVFPFELLDTAELPGKWRRIELKLPVFQWSLKSIQAEIDPLLAEYAGELQGAVREQVLSWLNSPEGKREAWRDLEVRAQDVASKEAWLAFRSRAEEIPVPVERLLPVVNIVLQVDKVPDYVDRSRASVRVVLDNRTKELSRRESRTRCEVVFNTHLSVSLPTKAHRPLKLDRVEPSYRFRHYLNYPAIGLNNGVMSHLHEDHVVLETTWAPSFVQPRVVPRKLDVPVSFFVLSDEKLNIDKLSVLPNEYKAWVESEAGRLRNAVREGLSTVEADIESKRLDQDIEAQRLEIRFIEKGIQLLQESQQAYRDYSAARDPHQRDILLRRAAPYRAWLLSNESFLKREANDKERGWHLFQLAFILAHIPTLASRLDEYRSYQDEWIDEETASLLYFPTGGGKSEAFYGTLLYAMFLDRLRGKQRGVTAMIRYPLRLLTLQQGQRLLKLVAHAEIIRVKNKLGDWPFEIGFWVGGSNTPNRYAMVPASIPTSDDGAHRNDERLEEGATGLTDDEARDAQRYRDFRAAYNKVPECPVCRSATGLRRFVAEGSTARRLGIVCFNSECAYNKLFADWRPLPFLLTDDTIYSRAPSVVLGTIDKMAMLGHHTSTIRKLLGMFGLARGVGPTGHLDCPRVEANLTATLKSAGYEPAQPTFRDGKRVFYDPFPSLIIQDEAHLLEESLGTFSGLFDTLLEAVLRQIADFAGESLSVARVWDGQKWCGPRMPKVIAATATISNPDRQLEVLYQRKALRFPCPGSDIYRSFFSAPAPAPSTNPLRVSLETNLPSYEAPEITAPWMRLFVSVMTNDATHTVTAVALLSAFHLVITSMWRGMLDPQKRSATVDALLRAQGLDVGSDWRRAAISRAVAENREAEIMALIDLHRIAIAYVTNKKGGDQIMDALDAAVLQRHRVSRQPLERFSNRLISGGIDMTEIQEIMKQAEQIFAESPYPEISTTIRSIIATSAISHGVDVDRFNSMFFAGLPSDIAEYIQASSRVGRTHVGFVLLIPTPQSRRDRYVVETHDIFHRFLERMIASPAVERWAENALRRVLSSLVQTWAVLREDELLLRAPDSAKDRVESYELVSPLCAWARRDPNGVIDDLGSFVLRAIGYEGRGKDHVGRPIYQELYRALIDQEISGFVQKMRNLSTPMRLKEYWDESGAAFKPPMTSLRDVDEAGIITAGAFDMFARQGSRNINPDELMHVMRAIRNQKGAIAEMDQDVPGAE